MGAGFFVGGVFGIVVGLVVGDDVCFVVDEDADPLAVPVVPFDMEVVSVGEPVWSEDVAVSLFIGSVMIVSVKGMHADTVIDIRATEIDMASELIRRLRFRIE